MENNSYVKLKDVIDPMKFQFWNKGTWTKSKPMYSYAKTKTTYGGTFDIKYKENMTYTEVVNCNNIPSKPILSTIIKCKSGKIDENDWMKSGQKD